MGEHKHLLEIYEPYEYEGPNPIHVLGTGVLRGPNGASYYLLGVNGGLQLNDDLVEQLLVLPRYNGDKIERAEQSCCTVNIVRVHAGVRLCPGAPFAYSDITHWGVGKITPLNGTAASNRL
ncbi:MAG: hypothetical protein WCY26_06510 [Thiohalobacteraceae bacterium]|nr:hypothetical protein [Gammaproteobacteria bacterium]